MLAASLIHPMGPDHMHATPPAGGWPRRRGGHAILANASLPVEDIVRWARCLGRLVVATTLGGNIPHVAPPQWQTTVGTHFEQLSDEAITNA
jgi:hypothetical protein